MLRDLNDLQSVATVVKYSVCARIVSKSMIMADNALSWKGPEVEMDDA